MISYLALILILRLLEVLLFLLLRRLLILCLVALCELNFGAIGSRWHINSLLHLLDVDLDLDEFADHIGAEVLANARLLMIIAACIVSGMGLIRSTP